MTCSTQLPFRVVDDLANAKESSKSPNPRRHLLAHDDNASCTITRMRSRGGHQVLREMHGLKAIKRKIGSHV